MMNSEYTIIAPGLLLDDDDDLDLQCILTVVVCKYIGKKNHV